MSPRVIQLPLSGEDSKHFVKAGAGCRAQITPEIRMEWLKHRAHTAWKYAMQDAGCRCQTLTAVRVVFCGTEISTASVDDHIRT